jgi:hypothetical protein
MKSKQYSQERIIGILKAHEAGAKVAGLIRKHAISEQSFYRRKASREAWKPPKHAVRKSWRTRRRGISTSVCRFAPSGAAS